MMDALDIEQPDQALAEAVAPVPPLEVRQAPLPYVPLSDVSIKHLGPLSAAPLVLSMEKCINILRTKPTLPFEYDGWNEDKLVSGIKIEDFGKFVEAVVKQHNEIMETYRALIAMNIQLAEYYELPRPDGARGVTQYQRMFFLDCQSVAKVHEFEIENFHLELDEWHRVANMLQTDLRTFYHTAWARAMMDSEIDRVHGHIFVQFHDTFAQQTLNYNIFEHVDYVVLDIPGELPYATFVTENPEEAIREGIVSSYILDG